MFLYHSEHNDRHTSVLRVTLEAWQVRLEELDVSWNSISQRAAASILSALASNRSLRSLSLAWNRLGAPGCLALASMLPHNSTLERLDLTNCCMTSAQCEVIAEAIRHNGGLRVMKLDNNALGHAGAQAMTRALQEKHIRYSLTEGDGKMSSIAGWADAMVATFDERTPSGRGSLQLKDPRHREVALKLAESASVFDGECWRNERYNGTRFAYTRSFKLPERGLLELDFFEMEPEVPDSCGTLEDKDFDTLGRIFQNLRCVGKTCWLHL
jgi:hypothetical protein